jgi:phosphate transport system substrate-binding protein
LVGKYIPAYNLKEVNGPLVFSGPVLADIFLGKVKFWDDDAVKELQTKAVAAQLPHKKISVVHRSDGSGTTYVWVDYLAKVSKEWKKKVGVATEVSWPAGEGAKGNEGVSGRVKELAGAIGYIELTYALQNKIDYGLVRNREKAAVKAGRKSIEAAVNNALEDIPADLRFSITDAPGKDSYPISGTVWAVLYVKQPKDKGQQVVDFLRWVTHEGQEFCEGLDYVKLPKSLVEKLDKKLDAVEVGK